MPQFTIFSPKFAKPQSPQFIEHLQFRNRQKRMDAKIGAVLSPVTGQSKLSNGGRLSPTNFSSIVTFTRASTALDTVSGNLQQLNVDSIRNNGSGWLIEDAVSNSITNPLAVGGGAVVPTGWSIGSPNAGLTVIYPGQVTVGGIIYQLIRFAGTMSAAGSLANIQFASGLAVTAAAGAMFSVNAYVYAGSLNGITVHNLRMTTAITPTMVVTLDGTPNRKNKYFTFATDTTASLQLVPTGANAAAIDITYALALPNLTPGSQLYAPVVPATAIVAASSKAADNALITSNSFLNVFGTGAPNGYLICDATIDTNSGIIRNIAQLDDGTDNNRIQIRPNTAGTGVVAGATIGGSQTLTATAGTPVYGTVGRYGLRWGSGVVSACFNGGAVVSISPGALPAFSNVALGRGRTAEFLNGRINSFAAGSAVLSDAAFQAACSPGADVAAIARLAPL